MKFYICRRGKPDFVCQAPTMADSIVIFWLATLETPKPNYRIHQGRRRQSKVITSAAAYWRLSIELQTALADVLEATLPEQTYSEFCEQAVAIGRLLENKND